MDKQTIYRQKKCPHTHKQNMHGPEKTSRKIWCIFCLLNKATTSEHVLYKYYVVYNYYFAISGKAVLRLVSCTTVQHIWCERKCAVKTNELYILEAESVTRELVLRFLRFIFWLTELENCELST